MVNIAVMNSKLNTCTQVIKNILYEKVGGI